MEFQFVRLRRCAVEGPPRTRLNPARFMANHFQAILCPNCRSQSLAGAQICMRCNYPLASRTPSHWTSSPWTIVAAVLLSFVMLCVAGFALVILRSTAQAATTTAYRDGLKLALASQEVRSVLGDHVTVNSRAFGTISNRYGSQFVEWRVSLAGSRSRGDLYGIANKINGEW